MYILSLTETIKQQTKKLIPYSQLLFGILWPCITDVKFVLKHVTQKALKGHKVLSLKWDMDSQWTVKTSHKLQKKYSKYFKTDIWYTQEY